MFRVSSSYLAKLLTRGQQEWAIYIEEVFADGTATTGDVLCRSEGKNGSNIHVIASYNKFLTPEESKSVEEGFQLVDGELVGRRL